MLQMSTVLTDEFIRDTTLALINAVRYPSTEEWIIEKTHTTNDLHSILQYRNTFFMQQLHNEMVVLNDEQTRRRLRSIFHTKKNRGIATSLYLNDKRRSTHSLFQYLCWPKYDKYFTSAEELSAFTYSFSFLQVRHWLYRDVNDEKWTKMITLYESMKAINVSDHLWEIIDTALNTKAAQYHSTIEIVQI